MFKTALCTAYRSISNRTGRSSVLLERAFDNSMGADARGFIDEKEAYRIIFDMHLRSFEDIYFGLIMALKEKDFTSSTQELEALAFVQEMCGVAMWKYQKTLPMPLRSFTREFDRLDVPSERVRLHMVAHAEDPCCHRMFDRESHG